MEKKNIKLEDKAFEHIKRIDASMRHHATQYTQASAYAQKLLITYMSMEEAKVTFVSEQIKKHGIDQAKVIGATVNSDGTVDIELMDTPDNKEIQPVV
jgi:hypothetical protein